MIKPTFRGQMANVDSTSKDMKRTCNGMDINFNARLPRSVRAFGGFTAGTGFDTPRGLGTFWLVTPATRYAVGCTGPCTPGALVLPALSASGVASISVPLVAPETEYTPRINQVDFSFSMTW